MTMLSRSKNKKTLFFGFVFVGVLYFSHRANERRRIEIQKVDTAIDAGNAVVCIVEGRTVSFRVGEFPMRSDMSSVGQFWYKMVEQHRCIAG